MIRNSKNKVFLIIDSHALIHRAYHALPKDMVSPQGELTNAVYGFTSVLIKVLKEMKPDYVVAAFDLPGPTFRHEAYEDYKATRVEAEEGLKSQFNLVREVVRAFSIPILEKQGYEADDIIGTVTQKLKDKKDIKKVIVTGDLDTLQLVDDENIVVYTLKRGVTDTVIYNEEKVKERFDGLGPEELIDYKGLKGDPSDNIPGVPGVGEKTAIGLLKKYKSLEDLYQNLPHDDSIKGKLRENLEKFKDQAFFSRELATIKQDAPINFSLSQAEFDFKVSAKVKKMLQRFGFRTLAQRLIKEEAFDTGGQGNLGFNEEPQDKIKEYFDQGVFSKKIYELEEALRPVLKRMEQAGFLIEVEVLWKLNKEIKKRLDEIKKESIKLAGEDFNLNSPQEVGRVLFEKLKLGRSRPKKTKTGAFSTSAEELEKIKAEHKIVLFILEWRELAKLLSTYIEALPKLVSKKDKRVHTTFNQFGAITGRLSSEEPNLQNIPIRGRYGSDIRRAFVAPQGWRLISADYSQIELRIAASFSGDKKMIVAFKRGEDIHTRTAAEVFNVDFEEVSKDMRRTAKILNFGIQYGMGANSFAQSAGISRQEAQEFIEEYYDDFYELADFIRKIKQKAYSQGYVATLWGRKRLLPELSSPNPGLRAAGERMAVNMPIQGTAADVIKAAMVAIDEKIAGQKDIKMILQVHDELIFEVKKEKVEEYAKLIKEIMEGVMELIVPLIVDVEVGLNWGEMHRI